MRVSDVKAFSNALILAVVGLVAAGAASAEGQGDKQQQQLRRLQSTNQKLSSEKAQLEQEKTRLELERSALSESVKSTSSKLQTVEVKAAAARREANALGERLAEAERVLAETSTKLKATEETLAGREADVKRMEGQLGEMRRIVGRQVQTIDSCEKKNARFFELNGELLGKYRDKGVGDALLEAEPFTGVKRVELDNLIQEYRDKLEAQKMEPAKVRMP